MTFHCCELLRGLTSQIGLKWNLFKGPNIGVTIGSDNKKGDASASPFLLYNCKTSTIYPVKCIL